MLDEKAQILICKEDIQKRVKEISKEITKDFKDEDVIFICILKGAVMFFLDVVRNVDLNVYIDFMQVSSYGDSQVSSGQISIKKDIEIDIKGKNVIIVEDIIDTGITLEKLYNIFLQKEPKSLEICVMFDKKSRRNKDVKINPKYIGFEIEDKFVVGYGLDYAEKYRNFESLYILS